MPEQRLKSLATLVALVLVGVIVTGALVGAGTVGDDLQRRAERALATAGLADIRVSVVGREATLSGGTRQDLARAERVVEGIDGVRWADIDPTDVSGRAAQPADTVPTLALRRSPTGVTISGTVPDADTAVDLKVRAAEAFAGPVTGDLAIDRAVGPATWLHRLPHVFGDLAGVGELTLTVDGSGTIVLGGTVGSQAEADRIRVLVAAAVPGLPVLSRLDVGVKGL